MMNLSMYIIYLPGLVLVSYYKLGTPHCSMERLDQFCRDFNWLISDDVRINLFYFYFRQFWSLLSIKTRTTVQSQA